MLRKLIVGGLLMSAAGGAYAASGEALVQTINAFFSTAAGLAGKGVFLEDGKRLMALLTVILIAWTGIWSVFSDGGFPEFIAKLVKLIFMAGICAFLLQPDTQQSLVKGFDYLAAKAASATGAPVNMENPADGVRSVMSTGLSAVKGLWIDREDEDEEGNVKRPWLRTLNRPGFRGGRMV